MVKACAICGSRSWRRGPGGMRVCEDGHVDMSYRKETIDITGDASGSQHRIRRVKRAKHIGRRARGQGNPDVYYGNEAEFLYWECVMLLVRQQVKALRHVWGLPAELETITQDLLQLCLLLNPLPDIPSAATRDDDDEDAKQENADNGSAQPVSEDDLERQELEKAHESDGSSDEDEEDAADNEDESGAEARGTEPDPDRPLEDEADESRRRHRKKEKQRHRLQADHNRLVNYLAVVVTACLWLRIPVMFREWTDLINTHQLPFLHFASSPLVPQEMRKHFNSATRQSLNTRWAPSAMELYRATSKFARQIDEYFGERVPEINASPILWKLIRSMGGSPGFYPAALALGRTLDLQLSLHHSLAPNTSRDHLKHTTAFNAGQLRGDDSGPPELSLMVLCVILFKLVYGLDGRDRVPVNDEDPATTMMAKADWLRWLQQEKAAREKTPSLGVLGRGEMNMLELMGNNADRYLDLAEKILESGEPQLAAHDVLFAYATSAPISRPFPPPPPVDPSAAVALISHAFCRPSQPICSLPTNPIYPPLPPDVAHRFETLLLPGEAYPVYASSDVTGQLPREMDEVVKLAAELVGVGTEELLKVLGLLEARLVRRGGDIFDEEEEEEEEEEVEELGSEDDLDEGDMVLSDEY